MQSKPTEAQGCRVMTVAASADHHCVHYNGGHSQSTPFRLITEFAEDWSQIGFPGNKLWNYHCLKDFGDKKNLNQKEVTTLLN